MKIAYIHFMMHLPDSFNPEDATLSTLLDAVKQYHEGQCPDGKMTMAPEGTASPELIAAVKTCFEEFYSGLGSGEKRLVGFAELQCWDGTEWVDYSPQMVRGEA